MASTHRASRKPALPGPATLVKPPKEGSRKRDKEVSFIGYLWRFTAYTFVVLFILLTVGISAGSALGFYRIDTVLSGSMEPEYSPGDVVVAFAKPKNTTAVGDVLIFRSPEQYGGETVTHRVVSAETSETGDVFIKTKGDANRVVDPWTARITATEVWEVRFGIPYVGYVSHHSKKWWPLLVAFAVAIPMMSYANSRVREAFAGPEPAPSPPEPEEREPQPGDRVVGLDYEPEEDLPSGDSPQEPYSRAEGERHV